MSEVDQLLADSITTSSDSPGLNSDDDAGAAEKSEAVLEAAPNPEKAAGAAGRKWNKTTSEGWVWGYGA